MLTHTLHYGCGVFEGIRAYETDRGPRGVPAHDHIERLFNSAKHLHDRHPLHRATSSSRRRARPCGSTACRPATSARSSTSATARWASTRCRARCNVSIAVWPWGTYLGDEGVKHGVRMKVSSWQRHDPNAMPPAAKGTGMYINSRMAKVEALKAGYDEAILLSPAGLRQRVHRREHLHRQGRRDHHAADLGRRARGHHPGLGRDASPRDLGYEVRVEQPAAQRPLHRRRGVPHAAPRPRSCRSARSTTARSASPARSPARSRRPTSPPCAARSSATRTGWSYVND